MTKFRGDDGVACKVCGKVRYPQPERGIFTVAERCIDCFRSAQATDRAVKDAERERKKAEKRARQGTLPGVSVEAPRVGLHGDETRGGRR